MQKILFPPVYKKALVNKTKNSTIRIKSEIGKYHVGKIYSTCSYSGDDWKMNIKIIEKIKTTIGELNKHNIPLRSINSVIRRENVSRNEKAEILKFKVFK